MATNLHKNPELSSRSAEIAIHISTSCPIVVDNLGRTMGYPATTSSALRYSIPHFQHTQTRWAVCGKTAG
jgi:hypothetical protein